ncbi:hypothetical protein BN1110_02189 [bacterium YEK0313]|nr:hypothetical protein BN1110_02189 [bacterium YEK0313]
MTQAARFEMVPVLPMAGDARRERAASDGLQEDGTGYDVGLSPPGIPYVPTDEDVEAVLAEFDGDPKRAIRALLEDIGVLADDRRKNVSYGAIYGHLEVVK